MKKREQLAIDPGTASSRLKKELLFHYVKKAGYNFCFRCGAEIENSSDFTIEHKIPWLDSTDPKELFFNLGNISFSHHKCNIAAARRVKGIFSDHGTISRYTLGCKCDLCKEAMKLWKRERRNASVAQVGGATSL